MWISFCVFSKSGVPGVAAPVATTKTITMTKKGVKTAIALFLRSYQP